MELWQLDVAGGIGLADGSELKALTGIDDHSRLCVPAALMPRATARPVCAAFTAALDRHGIPGEIPTDKGKVFTGRFHVTGVEVLFGKICRENGITHRLTAPYSPTATGKIERFHRSLRLEFLAGRVFASPGQAQEELDAWVHSYNHERPHQGIATATPAQRFTPATRHAPASPARPVIRLAERPAKASQGGQWITRKVGANGVICVAHQQISVGKHRAGEIVDVHLDGQLLQAWHGNELLKTITRDNTREVRNKNAAVTR